MNYRLPITLLALATLLSGCVTAPTRSQHAADDLNHWLEQVLNPYLAEQLGRHPKFKGEPFLLVAMKGDEVEPDIDRLRDEVRVRAFDHLINVPGVNAAWRPSVRPWRHHRTLAELLCNEADSIRYYIGIESHQGMDGDTRIAVRALDVKEGRWVSGFGKQWRGKLSTAQAKARTQRQPDEYLRGLRPLPFDGTQVDLTAAYLARNLSCLLQKRSLQQIVIHLENSAGQPAFFDTALELAGNYLSRFREVRITDDPTLANVTLKGEVHHLHGERYQVWLAATLKSTGERLAGTDTTAYVNLPSQQVALQPIVPEPPVVPASMGLIDAFTLMAPVSPTLCRSRHPWAMGARQLQEGEEMAAGDCLGVELQMAEDAWVFLLHQDSLGEMTRLLPESCDINRSDLESAGVLLAYPQLTAGQHAVLELEGEAGQEQFIAIATNDWETALTLSDATEGCDRQTNSRKLQRTLRQIQQSTPGRIEIEEASVYQE